MDLCKHCYVCTVALRRTLACVYECALVFRMLCANQHRRWEFDTNKCNMHKIAGGSRHKMSALLQSCSANPELKMQRKQYGQFHLDQKGSDGVLSSQPTRRIRMGRYCLP